MACLTPTNGFVLICYDHLRSFVDDVPPILLDAHQYKLTLMLNLLLAETLIQFKVLQSAHRVNKFKLVVLVYAISHLLFHQCN